jgi:sarcosine oxidase subunit gamma
MVELAALRRLPVVTATAALRPLQPMARYILRGDARVISAAGAAFGIEIRQETCRASQHGDRAALWLGPDEYLLLAPEAEANELARSLGHALQAEPHSLVDVSHRQSALEISGPQSADILNSGCPLDLDPEAFPVGMCTRTVFAKSEVVLWRTASDVFHIEIWRSFIDYVAGLLNEAAQDYRDA